MTWWNDILTWLCETGGDGYTTPRFWKLLGWTGAGLFALRWVLQAQYRKATGSAEMPTRFWVVSLAGAGLTTLYFIFGKNDSVGILQNALPATVALYNLVLDLKGRTTNTLPPA